ncbi:hypothetical protein Csa_022790 [Cucumis sativus]|nr:hypothetical protein Csa_022790 [Cucumis sativus]
MPACASTTEKKFEHCERVVKDWALSSLHQGINNDKHTLKDLLFFLHVPRTGGRSYYHCFLKKLYPSSQNCPLSHYKLRFDPRMWTHERFTKKFSLVIAEEGEDFGVVTIVRNPVDRVLGSYEFSVEVAARSLVHPDLASATKMSKHRDVRRQKGSSEAKSDSPYDMEDMLMPLKEFVDDPIVHDLVHNGATFQIAGLTNNSYLAEGHEIRHCVQKHKSLGQHVLHVAKKRLDAMLYVGLTAEQKESATMFANVVGAQVISQLRDAKFSMDTSADNQSDYISSWRLDSELESNIDQSNSTVLYEMTTVQDESKTKRENMTVAELIEVYEGCSSSMLKTQSRRRFASLKRISPANFSKEARRSISDEVLQQIRTLNYLDMELFEHAREIFAMRRVLMGNIDMKDGSEGKFDRLRVFELWKIPSLVVLFILLLVLFVFANARRRVSKVKV